VSLPNNINEVIALLDTIIIAETAANSRLAFFPVLYKKVTEQIQLGIENKEFEDNPRMEKLDVIFANRYIDAYHQFKVDELTIQSWQNAFQAGSNKKLLIIQHLLLGINAHINLDLGIAAAETVDGDGEIAELKNDFNQINKILAELVDEVQTSIGRVSPLFYLLEKVGKGKEDKLVSFSINLARDGAWLFANSYHVSNDKTGEISRRDVIIGELANKLITTKSRVLKWVIWFIRIFETKNVDKIVTLLNE